jgi:hypothetical protein
MVRCDDGQLFGERLEETLAPGEIRCTGVVKEDRRRTSASNVVVNDYGTVPYIRHFDIKPV